MTSLPNAMQIPAPLRFSDFKFSMIGQPPNLLARMTSPTGVHRETEEEDMVEDSPDEGAPEMAANGFRFRPSLLEVLTGGDKTTDNNNVTPPSETSVPQNQPTEFSPHTTSLPEVEMARQGSWSPVLESPVLTPTLGALRDLHAKVTASLRDLSPVDNSEALALSQSLNVQCNTLLTTARHAHDLAQQAFTAARESLNVSQECLVAAESIQPRVCGVLEAISNIGPAKDDPASKWNLSLQAAYVQLDLINQWANRKEVYDAMQKDRVTSEGQHETDVRPTSRLSPSTDGPSGTCAEQESAEREWVLAQEKVAERQRIAEEALRRRREAEELLEQELQDAQKEADSRAAKLVLLKAERQRAEEEEKRTQEHEARETEERVLALETTRQSGRASLGQQRKQQSGWSSGPQGFTLHEVKHKLVDKQDVRQRQEVQGRGEFEPEPAAEPTLSSQAPVESANPRRTETRSPPEAGEATTMRPVIPLDRESETPLQREVHTEADKQQGGTVAERPRVEDQTSQPLKPEVYKIGSAGAGAAEHRQVAASEPTGQHANAIEQQQVARPEACRRHEAAKSNPPEGPLQDQEATESSKLNEAQDQPSPSLFPPATAVDDPVQETSRNSRSQGTSFSVVGPIPTSPIGNITSRKTLAERYKQSLIFPKEKERRASPEQVTSTQGARSVFRQTTYAGHLLPSADRSTQQRLFNATTPFAPKLENDHTVERQALSGVVESLDNPSKAIAPPTSSDAFGNVIRLRSKVIPSSPGQQIFRGFPNPLLVKAECIAKKTGLEIQEGNVPSVVVSSEDISLSSKPTACQTVQDTLPATVVAQRSLDVTLPTVQMNEGCVTSTCANPGPKTSQPAFASLMPPPILFSAPPIIPNVSCHSPGTMKPHTLPTCDQQNSHVASSRPSSPMSPIMTIRTPEDERRHLLRFPVAKDSPKRSGSSQPLPDQARFQSSVRPKSDAHHDADSRMGPDLMSPSAWDGIQDDMYHQRKRPSRRGQHDRDTPSPNHRSPRFYQVNSRGEFGRPLEPARKSRSREISPRGRPPFRSGGNPAHVRPLLGARKRSRDEDRIPGPPPRRPRRGGHARGGLPVQRNSIDEVRNWAHEPTAFPFSELPELTTRMNASRLLLEEVPTPGHMPARATPLMQRMGHPSTDPVVDFREQALSRRHSPLQHHNHSHGSYNVDHPHHQGLLGRIAVDPPYPDPQIYDYHPHHLSNSNRRAVNPPRPPRFSGRGRGLQAPRSQSLLDRLKAPNESLEFP